MSFNNRAQFNNLMSKAFGSITSSYTSMGTLSSPALCSAFVQNLKDADGVGMDVLISTDGVNDKIILLDIAPGVVFDVRTNAATNSDYMLPAGTVIYVKTAGTPASGGVYGMFLLDTTGN